MGVCEAKVTKPSVMQGALRQEDIVAAVIVAVLLVPQSLAYALLAGLPPMVGVLSSLLPLLAYAALGSSSTLAVGPVAVLSMMTAAVAVPVAMAHHVPVTLVATVLALEMALVYAVAAALRLHVLAALLSAPVLHGFINGAALAIAMGQVPGLLRLSVKGNTLMELWASASGVGSLMPHVPTLLIGVGALILLLVLRSRGKLWFSRLGLKPRTSTLLTRLAPMVVVLLSMVWVALAPQAWTKGLALAGEVKLSDALTLAPVWSAPWSLWLVLLGPACWLALVAYVESLAVAEAMAMRRQETVLPRRELMGLAAANAAAAFSGGMPVAGGLARTTVNADAGAVSRWAGVWTALFLAMLLLVLGPWLAYLPKAMLAATIVVAVLSLVDFGAVRHAWHHDRAEAMLMVAVALITIVWGVEPALMIGVLASLALLLKGTARPHMAEVGRFPGTTDVFRNTQRFDVETIPDVITVRVDESLRFINTRWLVESLQAMARTRPQVRHVVLMMSGVNDIDFSGLEGLRQLAVNLHHQGVGLHFSELKGPVQDRLRAGGWQPWFGGQVFRTQGEAHRHFAAKVQDMPKLYDPAAAI